MFTTWSQRVSQRYQVRLPADVVAWLDEERWRLPGGGEFNQPLAPEQLLDPEPGLIWPGFMLPDTLPLVGNAYGDWLCLRISSSDQVAECLYWSHAGGDWIPYGRSFAESLLYDALRGRETGGRTPGGDLAETAPETNDGWTTHVEWSWRQLGLNTHELPALLAQPADALRRRLQADGFARWALMRDEVLAELDCELRGRSDYRVAQRLGVTWEPDYVMWMFDTDLIPGDRRRELSRHFALAEDELFGQNWRAAEQQALNVIEARHDLGWAYDVAGWAAERMGERGVAVTRYLAGIRPSLFADHTVPFRTHWAADGFGKFSAARLDALRAFVPPEAARDPYLQLYWAREPASLRTRVFQYWLDAARRAERARDPASAYGHYYCAGWDLGLDQLHGYAEILDGLERSATAVGAAGRARIAALQRGFLKA